MRHRLRQDLHTLVGPYVMGALPSDENRRFEEHVLHCDECAREVRRLTETTALLATAVAETPPEGLRHRVLEEVRQTRQVPPRPDVPTVAPGPWRMRFLFTLAACLVLVLALSIGLVWQTGNIGELRDREQAITAVLGADDASLGTARADGVTVSTVTSRDRGQLVVTTRGLTPLEEEDYQVWFAEPDGSVRSAGLIRNAEQQSSVLADGVGKAEAIAITVEPDGGSEQPTSEPFVSVSLGKPSG